MTVTFKGTPIALVGTPLQVGGTMPDFTLVGTNLKEVRGRDLTGIRLFITVPSLDTGVCDQEARRFNQEAARFPDVSVNVISLDLPFAQARWCGTVGVERIQTLSDYKDHSFGIATGTRIVELGLLTRAVFVSDGDGEVTYVEYVPEVSDHPDYDAVLRHLQSLVSENGGAP